MSTFGTPVSVNMRKSNLEQENPQAGDYVYGKEGFLEWVKQEVSGGGASTDQIKDAVEEYMVKNPIEAPADGGYYSPVVSKVDDDTIKIVFNASDSSLPDIPPFFVKLPSGPAGADGEDGQPGADGADGYSPAAKVTQTSGGATITVTDKSGTTTATIENGKDGADGSPGQNGSNGKDGITPHIGANGNWYLGDTDTGVKAVGKDGEPGGETVPDYVVVEAMSVLDKVIAAQGSRTLVLSAMTDMHLGSSDYTDGVRHACQGLKYIAMRIKLDVAAFFGDYTDEWQMDTETAVTDLEEVNALLDRFCDIDNLRLKGNHDHCPGAAARTYRYIMAHSDDVVWGSRVGGYFYRDFPAYKLRIICLNTTEVARDNLSVSDEQYKFFVDTLDMSAKDDAAEWGILILSHHPLDWTVSSGAYRFGNILNAYQTGGSWTDGTISCNYADKNSAIIVGNFHGHIHNLLTDKIYIGEPGNSKQTSVWRMAVPASRVDYPNHYGGVWQEGTTYSKTRNSAKDTSFVVFCIDLDSHTIKAFCYGAGYDRTLTYYDGSATPDLPETPDAPEEATNWLRISQADDGSVYNGKGYKENTRYSVSSKAEKENPGSYLSGWIPVTANKTVNLYNIPINTLSSADSTMNYIIFANDDRSTVWSAYTTTICTSEALTGQVYDEAGNLIQFTTTPKGYSWIRVASAYMGDDSVINIK